jgi:hypothetical protein
VPPATSAVRDDLLEHRGEGGRVDLLALPNGDGAGGLVLVPGRDALWVWHDRAVVEKHIHPVPGCQQSAHISFEREIRLARTRDGLRGPRSAPIIHFTNSIRFARMAH